MFKDLRSNEFVANMTFANGKNLGARDLDKHLFQMLDFPAGGKLDQLALEAIKSSKRGEVILRAKVRQRAMDEFERRVAQKLDNGLDPGSITKKEVKNLFSGGVSARIVLHLKSQTKP